MLMDLSVCLADVINSSNDHDHISAKVNVSRWMTAQEVTLRN